MLISVKLTWPSVIKSFRLIGPSHKKSTVIFPYWKSHTWFHFIISLSDST